MYNYNFVAPNNPMAAALGTYHTGELAYAFNTIALRGLADEENKRLVKEIHTRKD
jgi:hypothetical protein